MYELVKSWHSSSKLLIIADEGIHIQVVIIQSKKKAYKRELKEGGDAVSYSSTVRSCVKIQLAIAQAVI